MDVLHMWWFFIRIQNQILIITFSCWKSVYRGILWSCIWRRLSTFTVCLYYHFRNTILRTMSVGSWPKHPQFFTNGLIYHSVFMNDVVLEISDSLIRMLHLHGKLNRGRTDETSCANITLIPNSPHTPKDSPQILSKMNAVLQSDTLYSQERTWSDLKI